MSVLEVVWNKWGSPPEERVESVVCVCSPVSVCEQGTRVPECDQDVFLM